ncbi:putative photosynthetic complex assembly protein 2 [Rubricella aquisinus]|uniref:Putative photosynthetic complex assembly protein 2 n=1 Tax=Rubricella aquisinus TaxID=2028108 RepID=A0A840WFW3_9RHOB|nr:putative photosynthetic complex assembly protein PuhE [Rubricella aquisinus]MBB5514048.1 putative photosynthetic complex assembly protein 2 [Rubricella aquisinus]
MLSAILITLFLWWFSTGIILFAVNRAGRIKDGYQGLVVFSVPLLALAVFGVVWSGRVSDLTHVYIGFVSALGVWGWIEMAFLTGVITGPDRRPCPEGAGWFERFGRALRAISHHETALVLAMATLIILSGPAENSVGLYTFAVLFFARISAKLNLFLGVPNINVEFLPAPIKHLESYFNVATMNRFFPVSVSLLTFAVGCFVERALAHDADQIASTGFVLLATLTALALIEHWFMVIRLPDAALWRWLITERKPRGPKARQDLTPQG